MNYTSTRNNQRNFTFQDVFLKGLADDGGLFVPKSIKKMELDNLDNLSYNDLAVEIIYPFIGDFISKDDLISLISKSYSNFRSDDVVKISDLGDLKVLELFHGPTLAFKDIAMQLIGNFYQYYLGRDQKKINIIVATSGHARAILQGKTVSQMIKAWKKILNSNLSVRDSETLFKRPVQSLKRKKKKIYSQQVKGIENKLIEILGTKVKLKAGKNNGSIEISYYSDDDLERIIELIESIST